jgi:beta-N-acetylhexosaminidase
VDQLDLDDELPPRHRMPGSGGLSPRVLLLAAVAAVVVLIAGVWVVLRATNSHTPTSTAASGRATGHGSTALAPPASSAGGSAVPGDCVSATLASMSLEQQVGQLIMIGGPVDNPTTLTSVVKQYHVGSVFLAGRSTRTAAQLRADIKTVQAAAGTVPLHVSLDQEGGTVQTLSGPDFPKIPTAVEQGTWPQSELKSRAADWGTRLHGIGVTMDLAPVADVVPAGTASTNPPIGVLNRQFGSNPTAVSASVSTVVGAIQGAGVLTTLKHFPGLGRVKFNTDTSTKAVDDQTTATDPALQPFISGMKAGTGVVMISSALYPKLDPSSIAAFSTAIITGLLRQKLGYDGLVVSDDLGNATAASTVAAGDRAVRFIQAGGDAILSVRTSDAKVFSAALVSQVRSSTTFAARAKDAARHVLVSKQRAGLLHC